MDWHVLVEEAKTGQEPVPEPTEVTGENTQSEMLTLTQPTLINQLGQPMKNLKVGDMIGIESEIGTSSNTMRASTFIVQIKDKEDVTVFLSMVRNLPLITGNAIKPSVFWLAENQGEYDVEVFLG